MKTSPRAGDGFTIKRKRIHWEACEKIALYSVGTYSRAEIISGANDPLGCEDSISLRYKLRRKSVSN